MSRPSPASHPLEVTDLLTWAERNPSRRPTPMQQAHNAGHPSVYDREREQPDIRCVFVTEWEASLIVQALLKHDGLAWHQLAESVRAQVKR